MTPSISTSVDPRVTIRITTRIIGMVAPPAMRKRVCSGDFVERVKVSWKMLADSVLLVTSTDTRASMTSRGIGTGTPGPIISCRKYGASSMRQPRHSFGQGDGETAPRLLGQLLGARGSVRIAEAPEQLRIAERARGDVIEPLALHDLVLAEHGQPTRL